MYDFGVRKSQTSSRIGYRQDQATSCPDCGQTHWLVGRSTVECAYCSTALPLIASQRPGIGIIAPRPFESAAA